MVAHGSKFDFLLDFLEGLTAVEAPKEDVSTPRGFKFYCEYFTLIAKQLYPKQLYPKLSESVSHLPFWDPPGP